MKSLIAAAFIVALAVAGCAPSPAAPPAATSLPTALPPSQTPVPVSDTATPEPAATSSIPADLVAAAQQEGELNVIALPPDWLNYGEIIKSFAQRYHIVVNQLDPNAASAAELDAIRKTRTKDRASAPDVIDVGLPFAVRAKQAGLLQPYKVSTWDTIPGAAKDPDGYWFGDYYGLIVFEGNAAWVANMPQDWPDLLKADNKIALGGSPVASYLSMMTVYSASLANGGSMDDVLPGLRFFQTLNKSGALLHTWAKSESVATGEMPMALNWDYLALAEKQSHPDSQIEIVVPRSGNVAGIYAQGISAYAPHPNAAKLWMEYLYSDEGQLLFLKGLGHPIRFADLSARGAIPAELLDSLLPPEPYLNALFPTAKQVSAADASILGSWTSYVP